MATAELASFNVHPQGSACLRPGKELFLLWKSTPEFLGQTVIDHPTSCNAKPRRQNSKNADDDQDPGENSFECIHLRILQGCDDSVGNAAETIKALQEEFPEAPIISIDPDVEMVLLLTISDFFLSLGVKG